MKKFKLAIIGGRDFDDVDLLNDEISKHIKNITLIVSGGARGADSLGEQFAIDNDIDTLIFKPEWDKYGRGAAFIRNKTIIENCDKVIAFWDGKSKGTKNSIDIAIKLGKTVKIIKY